MLGAIGLGIGSMISFSDRFLEEALIFDIDLKTQLLPIHKCDIRRSIC